mgnify:CR=1 FL=1
MRALTFLFFTLAFSFAAKAQNPSDLAYMRCAEAKGPIEHIIVACTESLKEKQLTTRSRARIHAIKGNIYKENGLYEKAIAEYEFSIAVDPKYQYGYNGRAVSRAKFGDIDKAFDDFNKAIELDPKNSILFSNRAHWYSEIGNFEKSLSDYDKAIEFTPMNSDNYYHRAITLTSMKRMDDARSANPTIPDRHFTAAQKKIQGGDYDFGSVKKASP